jgi:dihydrofolate reductase
MKAIAAMSLNRVIGRAGQLPWHLPEEFRWFKQNTKDQVVLMGRKTYESLGRPLPHRLNLVVSRSGLEGMSSADAEGSSEVQLIHDLAAFDPSKYAPREVWVIGGAELYRQLLPRCEELLLTVVQRDCDGDTFFPDFESTFIYVETPFRTPDFEVRRYRHRDLAGGA